MTITENNDMRDILARLMDGAASDEELLRLLNWSKASRENSRELMAILGLEEFATAGFTPDDIDLEQAKAAIRRKIREKKRQNVFTVFRYAAAVLVLPFVGFMCWLGGRMSRPDTESSYLSWQTVQAPVGGRTSVTLPDGSLVYMNATSSISFPSEFKGSTREVRLEGEGYFEVQSDKAHPFIVQAPDLTVTVTGTKFNVNSFDAYSSVALLEGHVDVTAGSNATSLEPGQLFVRTDNGGSVTDADIESICGWKDGRLAFRDENMGHVLQRLGQYYGVEFVINDDSLRDYLYRGTFNDKPLNQILHVISQSIPVNFTDRGYNGTNGLRLINVDRATN